MTKKQRKERKQIVKEKGGVGEVFHLKLKRTFK